MIVIGLTGSMGMGKSTVASMLAKQGLTVLDADKMVHALLDHDKVTQAKITRHFPSCLVRGKIDRSCLFNAIKEQQNGLVTLENILHPLVFKQMKQQISAARKQKAKAVVCEVPLLFERGFDQLCDVTFCVFCSRAEQKKRVFQRKGMTEEKFKELRRHQFSVDQKRKRADFMVSTQITQSETEQRIKRLLKKLGVA